MEALSPDMTIFSPCSRSRTTMRFRRRKARQSKRQATLTSIRWDAYFIAQILSAQVRLIALVLDGFTSAPLGLKEAEKLKPFYFDHHFWKHREFYLDINEIRSA